VGGNFWDMRATGRRLGNPGRRTKPRGPPQTRWRWVCPKRPARFTVLHKRPYRALLERVWGQQAFAIQWPDNVEQVCDQPGPAPANDPMPVHLSQLDRGRVDATFDQMAQSIAGYEASAEITTFTSKFDAVLAGKAQFTLQEQAGYDRFAARRSATPATEMAGPGEDPLFTDFTASNIGTPANPRLPFYSEDHPTRVATSPIRQGRHSSMAVSALFSPRDTRSAIRLR